ncbi:MAG: hypothetical protein FJW23_03395 [Acidimicrobiia bacterium]|nr:hypothetical protein [Acidimicrobiia bacterium]
MRSKHLSEQQLVAASAGDAGTADEHAHLSACETCRARAGRLQALLAEVAAVAEAEADARFPSHRLEAQRSHILECIEQDGRPAQIIAFPAGSRAEVRTRRVTTRSRWVAAAAIAGLAIGLAVGRWSHRQPPVALSLPGTPPADSEIWAPGSDRPATARGSSEDEFLGQIEQASTGLLPELRAIHELTPHVEQVLAINADGR